MKIALYAPFWPPGNAPNGIVTYFSQLVPALRREGHEVFIVTPYQTTSEDDPYTINLQAYQPLPSLRNYVMSRLIPRTANFNKISAAFVGAIRALVGKHKLDVLEMEETFGLSFAISRLHLLPVVVRLHGPWFLNGRFDDPGEKFALNSYREEWEGRGVRHAQYVTAPSAEVLQSVKDHYGFNLPDSDVIPNPFDAAAEAKAWNIRTCDKDTLLFVGRFDRRKGGDLVLRVFNKIAPFHPNLRLSFVGPDKGIKDIDGKIWSFEHFIRGNCSDSCRSRIDFFGQLSHSDLMSLRTKHFITIIASQYEIMPYSVLEPMALGCPIVATSVGGIPELINNEKNGLLAPPQKVDPMAAACQKLLSDYSLAARLGHQAWEDCRKFHSPDSVAKRTIAAYQRAIENFRSRNVF